MRLDDIISQSEAVEITYGKSSIIEKLDNVDCIGECIYLRYMDELKASSVEVTLNEEEYYRYRYRPKLLAHKIYKEKEFYFLIYLLNNISSDKDFDTRKVILIPPINFKVVNNIFNAESKYITIMNNGGFNLPGEAANILDQTSIKGLGLMTNNEIDIKTQELRYEIDNIKKQINDAISNALDKNSGAIINDKIIHKITEIENNIKEIINSQLGDLLNGSQMLDKVNKVEEEVLKLKRVVDEIKDLNIITRIERVTTELNNFREKLNLLESSTKNDINGVNKRIEGIKKDFDKFKESINELLENSETDKKIEKLKKDIEDLKKKLATPTNDTRDIVLQLQAPLKQGVQKETEFFVPYMGEIQQVVVSTTTDTVLNSNLIFRLQIYNYLETKWIDIRTFEMNASDKYKVFDLKQDIDKNYIRIFLDQGNYYRCKGVIVVVRVKEQRDSDE